MVAKVGFRIPGVTFWLGGFLAVSLLFGLAEAFLQLFPPSDLKPFLGEQSGLTGPYQEDARFGVTYQSFDAFARENSRRLNPWFPLDQPRDPRPIWAMFGNSFFQAPGMLADTARQRLRDRQIFHLTKNEFLWLRLAQIQLLLEKGFRPERVIVGLMMVDMPVRQPLDRLLVTSQGALTYQPVVPGGIIGNTRLGLTAWCRLGWHEPLSNNSKKLLTHEVPPSLESDLEHLFSGLAQVARQYETPVTVVLIPSFEQICRGEPFGFQDRLTPLFVNLGLDVCDVRQGYLEEPNKKDLFIPDKHFSARGNEILLNQLLRHLDEVGAYPGEALP